MVYLRQSRKYPWCLKLYSDCFLSYSFLFIFHCASHYRILYSLSYCQKHCVLSQHFGENFLCGLEWRIIYIWPTKHFLCFLLQIAIFCPGYMEWLMLCARSFIFTLLFTVQSCTGRNLEKLFTFGIPTTVHTDIPLILFTFKSIVNYIHLLFLHSYRKQVN